MGTIMNEINWLDPKSQVSTHFTVHNCLFLPSWNRMATEEDGLTDEIKDNLVNLCAKMETVRHFLGDLPINVHCTFRPLTYNAQIGGATGSPHLTGEAMDFDVQGHGTPYGCNDIRQLLIPYLDELDVRLEDNEGPWVHIDIVDPHPCRFFKP